jgi:hypothetical protein
VVTAKVGQPETFQVALMAEPITEDDFEIWRENPVTRWVLAGLQNYADFATEKWKAKAWAGNLDPALYSAYRERTDAYEGLASITYDNVLGTHNPHEADE